MASRVGPAPLVNPGGFHFFYEDPEVDGIFVGTFPEKPHTYNIHPHNIVYPPVTINIPARDAFFFARTIIYTPVI